jgi:hypothetical protein
MGSKRRRWLLIAAAAVVLFGGGLVVVGLVRRPSGGQPQGIGPTATAEPTATVDPGPSTLDGTAYFFVKGTTTTTVYSLTNGKVTTNYRIPTPAGDTCIGQTVVVSPDGQYLAWVKDDDPPGDLKGTLVVSKINGTGQHQVPEVSCIVSENRWTVGSPTLLFLKAVDNPTPLWGNVNAATGAVQPAQEEEAVWSADRAFSVERDQRSFTVRNASGAAVHTVDNYSNTAGSFKTCGFTVRGISNDGRYVTIGGCASDPTRILGANFLFDTQTGQHVKLPFAYIKDVLLLGPDRAFVLGGAKIGDTMAIVSLAGAAVVTAPVPATVNRASFLTYKAAH